MPTHKVLRAVAHNFGHWLLSINAEFLEESWPVQHLLMAARAADESKIRINLLTGGIEPQSVSSKAVARVLNYVPDHFRDVVERSGSSIAFVKSAELHITFRFDEKVPGKPSGHSFGAGVIVPEMVPYVAVVTIVDDRNVVHEKIVREWWRDEAAV